MTKTILLAFSGGLDTSAIIPWLKDTYEAEVVAYCSDLGNAPDAEYLATWAKQLGAKDFIFEDLKEQFASEYVFPCIKANAVYQDNYLLGTSIARPLIAERMAHYAKQYGAFAVAHGCTGKGNDQLRFERAWAYLLPDVEVIAPWKIWDFKGRQDLIAYLASKDIVFTTEHKTFSIDYNLMQRAVGGNVLEDVEQAFNPDDVYKWVTPPTQNMGTADLTITFDKGIATHLNGEAMTAAALLTQLNDIAGQCGVGFLDLVEDRVIGLKSRDVYETPGATVLHYALKNLKSLCWDRDMRKTAGQMALTLGEQVYDGLWHSDTAKAILAFFEQGSQVLSGEIGLLLTAGQMLVTKRVSPNSLYSEASVSFESDLYNTHQHALGYCKIASLASWSSGQRDAMDATAKNTVEGAAHVSLAK